MIKAKFDQAYSDMVAIRLEGEGIVVTFRNSDEATVSFADLIPSMIGQMARSINWKITTLHRERGELTIPVSSTLVELPWTAIRQLTDPKFQATMALASTRQNQYIGRRLKEIRRAKKASLRDVATKSGLTQKALREWERGSPKNFSSTTLWKILGAMGCTAKDLAAPKIEG